MPVYTVHVDPQAPAAEAAVIKEGFNWAAFLFTVLWALYHRLWLFAVLLAALLGAAGVVAEALGAARLVETVIVVGIALWAGFTGNDWLRRRLELRGHRLAGVVFERDRDAAEQRFFSRRAMAAASE